MSLALLAIGLMTSPRKYSELLGLGLYLLPLNQLAFTRIRDFQLEVTSA